MHDGKEKSGQNYEEKREERVHSGKEKRNMKVKKEGERLCA